MSNKLISKISSYPIIIIFAGGLIATFLVKLLVGGIYEIVGIEDIGGPEDMVLRYGLIKSIILIGMVGPVIETAIFQLLPVKLLCKIKNISYWIPIAVSSVLFGYAHIDFSVFYMVFGIAIGYVFASLFVIYKVKKSYSLAFWLVCLIHSINNIVGVVLIFYFYK
jgi:hypothetical protein